MKFRAPWFFVCFWMVWSVVAVSATPRVDSILALWDKQPFFSANVGDILTTVKAAGFYPAESVVVLFESAQFRYNADGSETCDHRLVYRIQAQDAVDGWGQVQTSWSPWHDDKPIIRARIINPDGSAWVLDPSTAVEGQSGQGDQGIYSDSKTLTIPYPHISIGSLVEQEIIQTVHPMLANAGVGSRWAFGRSLPILVETVKITPPATGPFVIKSFGNPTLPLQKSLEGTVPVWTCQLTEESAQKSEEGNLKRDEVLHPFLSFSTAPSWQDLAKAYSRAIDQQINDPLVKLPLETLVSHDLAQTAARLMHWLNKRVRYVGLELGQNSIIPYKPSEVLQRGYGDCKDKAVLLAAFLRQAGYQAFVGLLWNESNLDVMPDVPGLDWFDHAIVYVTGDHPLWLDPTADFNPGATLPYWDQKRWVLVAADTTKALLQTPEFGFENQEITETCDYFLKDFGNADVTEDTVYSGGFDTYYRQRYAYADPDQTKKNAKKYAADEYQGATLDGVSFSKPDDLDTPFSLTIRVKSVGQADTSMDSASVSLRPKHLLSWLPDVLVDEQGSKRVHDFRLSLPFLLHWKNRIHLPVGFGLRFLPEDQDQTFGTIWLHRHAWQPSNDIVEVDYDWKTKNQYMTPAEFEQTRTALVNAKEIFAEMKLSFDLQAKQLLDAGRFRDAFALYREQRDKAPLEAMPLIRFSRALLSTGFGGQAAVYARQAAAIEPHKIEALTNLAWVLQFDQFGRRFGSGYDRDGALEAYDKAIQEKPELSFSRVNKAILLEYNEQGLRYENPDDLKQAVALYDKVGSELADYNLTANPLADLWYLRQWDDVAKRADTVKDAVLRAAYTWAAQVPTKGAAETIAQLRRSNLDSDTLRSVMERISDLLIRSRRYKDAAAFLHEAAQGSSQSVNLDYRASLTEKLTAAPDSITEIQRPQDALSPYLYGIQKSRGLDLAIFIPLVEPSFLKRLEGTNLIGSLRKEWDSLSANARKSDLPVSVERDYIVGTLQPRIEGTDAEGYHIQYTPPGKPTAFSLFVVRSEKGYRIAAVSSLPASIGDQLDQILAANNLDTANQWIRWFLSDWQEKSKLMTITINSVWGPGRYDREAILAVSHILRAFSASSANAIQPAESDIDKTPQIIPNALAHFVALSYQFIHDHAASLRVSRRWASNDSPAELRATYQRDLFATGAYQQLESLLKTQYSQHPNDQEALWSLVRYYIHKADIPAAEKLIADHNLSLTALDDNNLAWAGLLAKTSLTDALNYALASVNLTGEKTPYNLNTLAAVYAEMGRLDEAHQVLLKSISLNEGASPQDGDWYVMGRIAEGCGLLTEARDDYQKVTTKDSAPDSPWALAQARLAGLTL